MMNNIVPVCTVEEVREEFRRRGISVSDWARSQGVSAQLTYRILSGRTLGLRGQSHTICVLLGLKPGVICSANDLKFAHARGATAETSPGEAGDRPTQSC